MEEMSKKGKGQGAYFPAPEPISQEHDLSGFDCGEPVLNDWLKKKAVKNESRFSRTYVLCNEKKAVVAYVCISAGAVERKNAPSKLKRNAPNSIPVSIIGRLAVDQTHAGKGLGADMLSDAMRRIALASQTIGIGAVVIQAKDDAAKNFYLHCAEFIEYPDDSRTLFLPIETLVAAFS
ncbi:MAG: GNAT family N-acetyltransferase [Erythrobacter sp.]|uniref:GNAT family N-acetyltransferase n=1 Tax=Erythrobacter sp. TaxID=1042 RepID=UPI002628ABBA|nr:GNAT family N-acetyltransferase [Erythrobacter sp.]MDJ0977927.1 GNAT family N-acetyltransferase [Erythrobacter sp.]